ncbi:MAG TPA: hypothetical protein VGG94_06590 [Chthoniobacterales bacterium]
MKPTPQNITGRLMRDDQRSAASRLHVPKTDYALQAITAEPVAGALPVDKILAEARSFRKISRQFLELRADGEYLAEAIFFAWISLTAAWPLGVLVRQLTTMMI